MGGVGGRKVARAGGRAAVREQWAWQEVWRLSPAPASSSHAARSEWAGWRGEQRTTRSGVRPVGGAAAACGDRDK